jgi:decaprenylphospho-beta-D-erythro-pentofuranosid-2-ulose 2-reductase
MSAAKNILIIGATSAIAEATARLWAADGANLYLLARNPAKLELAASDLQLRGARVHSSPFDANQRERHATVIGTVFREISRVDVALVAHGDLPEQRACEGNADIAFEALQTNAISVVSILTILANKMETQRSGVIVVIGSVAGDRGRKSNYVYGSAKALVATFAEGLAGRLQRSGVSVITIKPGFVDTPMTANFKKGLLWATPDAIAKIIHSRVDSATSGTFYAPRFWRLIMATIKLVPSRVLYRLNI